MNKLYIIIISVLFFAACSVVEIKEDVLQNAEEEEAMKGPKSIAPTSALELADALHGEVSKVWKPLAFEMDGIGSLACRLDDEITLYADGTYSYNGGTQLCGGEDSFQTRIGQYLIDFDNKQLIFDKGTDLEATASITGLENGELLLSGKYYLVGIKGYYQSK